MIGKHNTGGFDFSRDKTQYHIRFKGTLDMTFGKGARVRVDNPGDQFHNHVGVVEFISADQPTIYGVRFQPTGGTGEYLHSQLIGVGLNYGVEEALASVKQFADALQDSALPRENRPAELKKFRTDDPMYRARQMVWTAFYSTRHVSIEDIYVVWFCATLKNWKALISTNIRDNHYYEVTHDGETRRTYVDQYTKTGHHTFGSDFNL
jgi:hypothetical protein